MTNRMRISPLRSFDNITKKKKKERKKKLPRCCVVPDGGTIPPTTTLPKPLLAPKSKPESNQPPDLLIYRK